MESESGSECADESEEQSFEHNLSLEQLQECKKAFEEAAEIDPDGRVKQTGLTLDMFISTFMQLFGKNEKTSKKDWETLFMRVDANGNGIVDWDEFSTFLLMGDEGLRRMVEDKSLEEYIPLGNDGAGYSRKPHKDLILDVYVHSPSRRYVSIGRDSTLRLWNASDLRFQSLIPLERSSIPTATCRTKDGDHVFVAHMNRVIVDIDVPKLQVVRTFKGQRPIQRSRVLVKRRSSGMISRKDDAFRPQPILLRDLDGTVQSLSIFSTQSGEMRALGYEDDVDFLTIGLESGEIQVFDIKSVDDWTTSSILKLQVHDDWVTHLTPAVRNDSVLSSSMDTTIKLTNLETGKVIRTLCGHRKGIKSFVFDDSLKLVVSGSLDRQVGIWNPFIGMPLAMLEGHSSPIVKVMINPNESQVISVSEDKVVRIWDIRTYKLLQTFVDKTVYSPDDRVTALEYDVSMQRIITAGNFLQAWPMKKTIIRFKEGIVAGHQEPLIGAQFNSQFNQVVSIDPNCVVVWDPSDGHIVFRFEHEDAITCHTFDVFQRRLITGHVNGEIRVWNYINGQVLQVCTYEKRHEFTKVIHVDILDGTDEKFIVGATWDRKIRWWSDSESLNEKPDSRKRTFEQSSDIVSLAYLPPHSIVSGSDCGDIIFFNANSGNVDLYIRIVRNGAVMIKKNISRDVVIELTNHDDDMPNSFSVEEIIPLPRKNMIAACCSDGHIRFFHTREGTLLNEVLAAFRSVDSITCGCCSNDNLIIAVGDSVGFVRILDVGFMQSVPQKSQVEGAVRTINAFFASREMITAVSLWEEKEMIIVASADSTASIWSFKGEHVGTFGQEKKWNINDISTFDRETRSSLEMGHYELRDVAAATRSSVRDLFQIGRSRRRRRSSVSLAAERREEAEKEMHHKRSLEDVHHSQETRLGDASVMEDEILKQISIGGRRASLDVQVPSGRVVMKGPKSYIVHPQNDEGNGYDGECERIERTSYDIVVNDVKGWIGIDDKEEGEEEEEEDRDEEGQHNLSALDRIKQVLQDSREHRLHDWTDRPSTRFVVHDIHRIETPDVVRKTPRR